MKEQTLPYYRKKSPWQKDECIRCGRQATLEAFYNQAGALVAVRCCDSASCKLVAWQIAIDLFPPP